MSQRCHGALIVLWASGFLGQGALPAEERPLSKIAATGETAGGTGDVFYTLDGSPVINDAGDVAFRGGVAAAGAGPAPTLRRGIWKGSVATGQVEVIAVDGGEAPGGTNLKFKSFSLPAILADGRVLFLSSTDADTVFDALFVGTSHADVKRVVAAPDVGSTRIEGFLASDLGFSVVLTEKGLYSGGETGSFEPVATIGGAAPGAGGATFTILGQPAFNFGGSVAFTAFLGGAPPDADSGAWLGSASDDTTLLYREGAAAPARAANGNQLFHGFSSTEPAFNRLGEAAVLTPLTGGTLETAGIFKGTSAADLSAVAIRGTLASSGAGDVSFTTLFSPVITGSGAVYFTAVCSVRSDPRPSALRGVSSLWRADGTGLQVVAGMAGTAPGTTHLFGRITSFAVNANNRAAFTAELHVPGTFAAAGFGLWTQDETGAFHLQVRTGDTVPITPLETRTVAANADSILLLNPVRSVTDALRRGPHEGVPTGWADGDQAVFRLQFTGGGALGSFGLFGATFTPAPPIVEQPVVNSVDDDPDNDPGDGVCDTGGTVGGEPECTLRAALMECNASDGINRITFAIESAGAPTVFARSALPPLAKAIVIDATTQEGGRVTIHGGSAGAGVDGLRIQAEGCEAKGLTVTAFKGHGIASTALGVKLGSPDCAANGGDGISAPAGAVTVEGQLKATGNTGHGIHALGDVILGDLDDFHETSSNGQNGILAEGKVVVGFGGLRAVNNGRSRSGEACAEDMAAGVAGVEIDVEVLEARGNCGAGLVAHRDIIIKRVILEDNTRDGARSVLGGITLWGDEQFISRNKLSGLDCAQGTADLSSSLVIGHNTSYGVLALDIKLGGSHAWIEDNGLGGLRAYQTITSTSGLTVSRNGGNVVDLTCRTARLGGVQAAGDITLVEITAADNCGSAIFTDEGSVLARNVTLTSNRRFGIHCPTGEVTLLGSEHTISSNFGGGIWVGDGAVRLRGKATLHSNGLGRSDSDCQLQREAAIITDGAVEAEDLDLRNNCGSGVRCRSLVASNVSCTDHDKFGLEVTGSQEVVLNGTSHQIARNGFDGVFAPEASVTFWGEAFLTGNGTKIEPGECSRDPPAYAGVTSGGVVQGQTVYSRINCGAGVIARDGVHIDRLVVESNTNHGLYVRSGQVLLSSGGRHVLSRNGGDGLAAPSSVVDIQGTLEANANEGNGLTVKDVTLDGGTICNNGGVGIQLSDGGTARLNDVQINCENGDGAVRTSDGTIVNPPGKGFEVSDAPNPSPGDAPAGQEFPAGFNEVSARQEGEGGGAGAAPFVVAIVLMLPAGLQVETYYNYGPTPDRPTPHWYEFLFDGSTGAEIGPGRVVLHLVDGLRGDDDLTANGLIHSLGGPAIAAGSGAPQRPGDCNHDGRLDISDALCLLGFLFLGNPSRLPCGDGEARHAANLALLDWQPDGDINIGDAVSVLGFLFQGGPAHALVRGPGAPACAQVVGCSATPACP